ncbi:VOC family protein [Uliginosibacterium aquaticum]|uniref:hypothetical protein n=1 Tax=Uliginosibacterium aquaticum TaxID=2731212 RepID=UPI001C2DAC70|nr:hypothetical protein [Uliginosibacterium aquaticum]
MKRFHVHVSVEDLAHSLKFYSVLFGAGPAVVKADYAKWMRGPVACHSADRVGSYGLRDKACDAVRGGSPAQGAQRSQAGHTIQPKGRARMQPHGCVAAPRQGATLSSLLRLAL